MKTTSPLLAVYVLLNVSVPIHPHLMFSNDCFLSIFSSLVSSSINQPINQQSMVLDTIHNYFAFVCGFVLWMEPCFAIYRRCGLPGYLKTNSNFSVTVTAQCGFWLLLTWIFYSFPKFCSCIFFLHHHSHSHAL